MLTAAVLCNFAPSTQAVIQDAFDLLLPAHDQTKGPVQEFCPLLNVSRCPSTEASSSVSNVDCWLSHAYHSDIIACLTYRLTVG